MICYNHHAYIELEHLWRGKTTIFTYSKRIFKCVVVWFKDYFHTKTLVVNNLSQNYKKKDCEEVQRIS